MGVTANAFACVSRSKVKTEAKIWGAFMTGLRVCGVGGGIGYKKTGVTLHNAGF